MINLFIILTIIAIISNVIVIDLDPLTWLKDKLGLGTTRKLKSEYKFIDIIFYTIWKLLNCSSCLSYWITVAFFYFIGGSLIGLFIGFLTYGISAWLYNYIFIAKINF